MNNNKKTLLFVVCLAVFPAIGFCWSGSTHWLISKYAFLNSKVVTAGVSSRLNLERGHDQSLTVGTETRSVIQWVLNGAEKEDAGQVTRSNRHFHEPLKPFAEAGLFNLMGHFMSSLIWAQDGAEQNKCQEGDMSWEKIREYFRFALISDTEESRQLNLGLLFKGLGHQIHLVQDMGCPEHSRNDSHPFYSIENWAADHEMDVIDGFCQSPLPPDVDLTSALFDSSTNRQLVPIARLSDADVYVANNPAPSGLLQQGLAEYSNSNFFSEDTVFSAEFPYPKFSSTNAKVQKSLNNEFVSDEHGVYLSKNSDGEAVAHLTRLRYFARNFEGEPYYTRVFDLDSLCYKDYSSMLIPRTVGYSAGMLNYFFRGEIEVSIPQTAVNPDGTLPAAPQLDGVYAFTDDSARGFERISLMARNVTPDNEEMANGVVNVVVSYRLGAGSPFVENPPVPGEERYYRTYGCPGVTSIPRESPVRIDVDMTGDPLPVNAVDVTLTVVFRGDLGGEKGCAVAVGFKDISEPTPIDLFNNSDQVCFNGSPAGYAEPAVVQAADRNGNGKIDYCDDEPNIIPRIIKPICLSWNGIRANDEAGFNYYHLFPGGEGALEIPPLGYHRLFVLADNYPGVVRLSVHVHQRNIDPAASLVPFTGSCMSAFYSNPVYEFNPYTNVLLWGGEETGYSPLHSSLSRFRDHLGFDVLVFDGVSIPEGTSCSLSSGQGAFSRDPADIRGREAKRAGDGVVRRIRQ